MDDMESTLPIEQIAPYLFAFVAAIISAVASVKISKKQINARKKQQIKDLEAAKEQQVRELEAAKDRLLQELMGTDRKLEREIAAANARMVHEAIIPKHLEELDEIKNWFNQGDRVWRLSCSEEQIENLHPEFKKTLNDWELQIGKIKANASSLSQTYNIPFNDLWKKLAEQILLKQTSSKYQSLESTVDIFHKSVKYVLIQDSKKIFTQQLEALHQSAIKIIDFIKTNHMPKKYKGDSTVPPVVEALAQEAISQLERAQDVYKLKTWTNSWFKR